MKYEVEFKNTIIVEAPENTLDKELDRIARESYELHARDYIQMTESLAFMEIILTDTHKALSEVVEISSDTQKEHFEKGYENIRKISVQALNQLELILQK